MLDVQDFIAERGGNPEKVRESQRRRHVPEAIVDIIIQDFEKHRKSELVPASGGGFPSALLISIVNYEASQIGAKINATQKEIGAKKKVQLQSHNDLIAY